MHKTSLVSAILAFNITEIESLINSGENINQSWDGFTPIQYAIYLKKVKIAKLLIANNADLRIYDCENESPLEHIFKKFKEPTALSILKSLPDIHIADNYERNTALHYASRRNYTKCIDYLIDKGANPNALNRHGQSAIFFAAKSDAWQSIDLLASRGADVDLRDKVDKKFWSPIFYAICKSHAECVSALIKHGAYVNLVDSDGSTPIFYAFHDIQLVSLLVMNGANLEVEDKYGRTPLFHAVFSGNAQIVELLMRYGSKVDHRDYQDRSSMQYAIQRGDDRIVQILMNRCNSVEYLGNTKNCAVELATDIG
ncbi:ankyrin repeat domain-containing protein [Methylomonas sp. LL1]|uniref:ankyrin repeat domain-containing protein n=1 Tax=Methylomonas sp. LL1 TaxID=2785785 RepID=UPI0018C3550B|nr:ankyrin repeat domain-containing protein [Methylomonas sp. LL1]QPK62532.1 ankyrin repeat domain-containing protein [Methylomonas sp. LL1]